MALHFIRKRAIVVYSGLLESIIDDPAQVRALLAHELCHCKLNFAFPRRLLLYQSAKFRSARELTCDNAGLVASGDLDAAVNLLRKLCAGPQLSTMVSKSALIQEAELINSGFAGWVLRRFISHPPAGTRMKNLEKFSQEIELPLKAASSGVQPAVVAS
ncbi:MAG TPA: M48 family metalloprotease, partial [Phycisphaerae bacterium]|nr:M48 family metalloprotease [Phycisphaerae bacterium]